MRHGLQVKLVVLTLGAMLGLGSATPSLAQRPDTVWPNNYKLVLDTTRVGVYEVTFKPGDSIGVYSHRPNLGYVLSGTGKLRMYYSGEDYVGPASADLDTKPGMAMWSDGDAPYATKNVGTTEVTILLVELKDRPMAPEVKNRK
jgi:hypothetical protein